MMVYIPIDHINMLHRLPGPDEAVRAACEAGSGASVAGSTAYPASASTTSSSGCRSRDWSTDDD